MQLKDLKVLTDSLAILYVEDDIDLRRQNREFMEHLFKKIEVADDGERAMELYQKHDFDIVITDINIPKINGLSMIKMMKKKNAEQKFLVTTVYKQEELKSQLCELNIKNFLSKPIQTIDLLREIEDICHELVADTI